MAGSVRAACREGAGGVNRCGSTTATPAAATPAGQIPVEPGIIREFCCRSRLPDQKTSIISIIWRQSMLGEPGVLCAQPGSAGMIIEFIRVLTEHQWNCIQS
jgi:hypothetical protein